MNAVIADEVIYVPLSKLRVSEKNVRKAGDLSIPQLAAQIRAEGLLQNLVVTRGAKGLFDIVDGKRRYLALQHLSGELLLDLDREVAVKVVETSHATSASLSAAFSQLPLHPVDQFDAFQALVDEGKSAAEIAASFGIQERAVLQSLRLAAVARPIVEAYRAEEISLTALQAYTVSEDQERQLTVFESNGGRHFHTEEARATVIRNLLTEKEVPDTDPRIRFVGREAYLQAGGSVRADLFSPTEYFTDTAILQRLANEKIADLKSRVEAEGWSWVDVKLSGYQGWDYQARPPKILPTTPEQDKEVASIDKRQDEIGRKLLKLRRTEPDESDEKARNAWMTARKELEAGHAALDERREAIEDERRSWGKKALAESGAVLTLQGNRLVVHRGLMNKKTAKKLEKAKKKAAAEKTATKEAEKISQALCENLTAHRSAVIRDRLRSEHRTALAVLLHGILPGSISHDIPGWSRATLSGTEGADTTRDHQHLGVDIDAFAPLKETTEAMEDQCSKLPSNNLDLLVWLLEQDTQKLLKLVALCAVGSFDAIFDNIGEFSADKAALTDVLVEHLDIDMRSHWRATGDSYFNHVSKELIVQAVTEAKGEVAAKHLGTLSKADAAAAAEIHLENEDWVPVIFRRNSLDPVAPVPGAEKKRATKQRKGDSAKSQHVSQEQAVEHIQHLLDTKRQRDAAPASTESSTIPDNARPVLKTSSVTKAVGKKAAAKKAITKTAAVKKAAQTKKSKA